MPVACRIREPFIDLLGVGPLLFLNRKTDAIDEIDKSVPPFTFYTTQIDAIDEIDKQMPPAFHFPHHPNRCDR